jgi:IS5 family transposase
VGVDSKTKIIHTAVVTAANVSDAAVLPDLLHGEETRVWGDGAYQGQTEVIRACAPRARDFTQRRCRYKTEIVDEVAWAKNRTKSKVRAKVEHVFQVLKLRFGFVKVRYRGLKKNAHRTVFHQRTGQSVCRSQEAVAGAGVTPPVLQNAI